MFRSILLVGEGVYLLLDLYRFSHNYESQPDGSFNHWNSRPWEAFIDHLFLLCMMVETTIGLWR